MKKQKFLTNLIRACGAMLLLLSLVAVASQPARAASYGEVVISEIMYDPVGTDSGIEWVELYNPTAQAIDVSGWVITDASSFPTIVTEGKCVIGTGTIPAMGFIVVSPSSPNPSLPGITITQCTMSGTFLLDSSDNLALFTEDSVNGELVFGTLGLDASGNISTALFYPPLAGTAGRSIGLKDPMAGWSGSGTPPSSSARSDWAVETTSTPLAANDGWVGQITTPHTITFNGAVDTSTEWQFGELLGAADGDPTFTTLNATTIANTVKYYVTWDSDNLYVGFIAPQIVTNRQHYNVVIDTDPYDLAANNDGLTSAPAANCNASYEVNGKADLAFQINPTSGFSAAQVVAGSWQSWSPANSSAMLGSSNTQAEFRLNRSDLGLSTDTQPIGMYLYVCNDSGNVVAAWPPENAINPAGAVAFTTRTVFDTTGATRSPRDEAIHLGYQTRIIGTATGTHAFFDEGGYLDGGLAPQNWYVHFIIESGNGSTNEACQVTVKVVANDLVTRLGGVRRMYDIEPANCDGLFTRLSLKYEDGQSFLDGIQTDNDIYQTPSEIRGLDENAMIFYHNTGGSNWEVISNLTRSTAHNRVAHLPGYGTSEFSSWGFGYQNNAPTALTLNSFTASNPLPSISIGIVILAALLVSFVLVLAGWRRMAAFQKVKGLK